MAIQTDALVVWPHDNVCCRFQ